MSVFQKARTDKLKKYFSKKNVLVTGGLGFIGSTLAHELARYEAKVVIVDSLIPHYGGNMFNINGIEDKVKVNIADVRDEYSLNCLVQNQDCIFNMAGTLSHIDSMRDPQTDLEINCRSQLTILEACRKYNSRVKIIFAGTRGQYGKARYLPVDEKHPMEPIDVNGINNIAGEWYHILYNNVYGIRAVSLRLTNVYGPRHQMKHSRQGFLNWFIRLALDNKVIRIFGDGKQLRDFNYVDDVANAILLSAINEKMNGEVYNLGTANPTSVIDVARLIVKIAGSGKIEFAPFPAQKKVIEIGDYYADYSKIQKVCGWRPEVSLEDGIKYTIEFYQRYRKDYWTEADGI